MLFKFSSICACRRALRSVLPLVLLTGILLASALPAPAQSYLVHQYGVDTDLPHADVFGMTQGSDGRIWFATRKGIAAYDGQEWATDSNSTDFPANRYSHICTDGRGWIWATSPGAREVLSVYDGQSWTTHSVPADTNNSELVVTGLAVIAGESGKSAMLGTFAHGLWLLNEGTWRRIKSGDGIVGDRIHDLAAGRDRFIVATDRGLASVTRDGAVDTALTVLLPSRGEKILAILPVDPEEGTPTGSQAPEIWILTDKWIGSIRDGALHIANRHALSLDERPNVQPAIQLMPGRAVFYATLHDIYLLDLTSSQVIRLGRSSGLIGEGATDLLVDREGNLWISCSRGVSKIASMRFENFSHLHGLLEDEVSAISEPRPGTLIFGHNNGLTIRENGQLKTKAFPRPPHIQTTHTRILDIFVDSDGTVWLAGTAAGLGRLSPSGDWQWYECGEAVNAVLRDGDRLLIGTTAGVYQFNGERITPTRLINPELAVRRLFKAADGSIYMATMSRGLHRWINGRTELLPAPESVSALDVYNMFEDREGRFWVGTSEGLYMKRAGRLVRPTETGLDFLHPVYFILQDDSGDHWFGTDNGLIRWKESALRHFTTRDGLAGRETNRAAALVDSSGQLWIGTDSGVSRYCKKFERESTVAPLVQLDHLQAGDTHYPLQEPLSLGHDSNSLEFTYRAVSFVDERAILYSSRLEGFEDEWCNPLPAGHRSVRYTNLPPGSYRFLLRAANADGVWSAPLASPLITIRTPFWNRWWFYAGCFLLLGLIIYWAIAALLHHRYTIRLESEVQSRTTELADSESRYRLLFDNAAVAKLLIDQVQGRILEANDSACRLLGIMQKQLVGSLAGNSDAEWLWELGRRIEADPDCVNLEFTGQQYREAEESLEVEVKVTCLTINGEPQLLALIQDVTEKRRMESERLKVSKLESLGLLAGGIAHDFNNFLTGILGNISLARRLSARGEDVTELLDEAENSVPRAKSLTDQLLTFARGGAPVRRPLDLAGIARSTATFSLTGSGVTCDFDLEETLMPVEADEGQMGQVVSNLVINAVQASTSQGKITLSATNCDPDEVDRHGLPAGPYVKLTVQDDGEGIDPQIMDQIFDPYFSTRDTGSGLGLATVYSIVTMHHGTVKIDSITGEGTTAMVLIPASPDAVIEEEEDTMMPDPTGNGRILVMDDEQTVRRFYHRVLTYLGYQPETVPDGESAINHYLEAAESGRPFDLVILDLTVPNGMGGEETLRILRQENSNVKAIVSSGYSNAPLMANHREAGFIAVLRKPVSTSKLARTLKKVQDRQDS